MVEQAPALVPVAFRGGRGASGPLTFGQRNTLNWVGNEADRYSAVIPWRFALPDGVTVADVAAAFAVLLARHEALRTCYPDGTQVVAADGELSLEVQELAADQADLDEQGLTDLLVARLRGRGVDYTTGLPLRVAVATRDGVPACVVVVYSHMAVDFASMALISRQFTELAGDPAVRDSGPPEHQPLEQAAVEQAAHGQRQAATAVRYWADHLRAAPQSLYAVPPPEQPGEGFRTAMLHSPAGGLALGHIAARTGAGRQAALIAAFCAVLAHRTGVRECVFAAVSSNRFRSRLHGYVGSLAQDGLMSVTVDGGGFDDLVRRSARATLAAHTHSMFDATRLWQAIDEIGYARGTTFTRDVTVNNISAHLDGEPSLVLGAVAEVAAALPRTTLRWMPSTESPVVLMCNPVRVDPELMLALTPDLRLVAGADVEALLRGVERLLVAAAGGDAPLADLAALSGVSPAVRGPDWVLVDSCWVALPEVARLLADALGTPAHAEIVDGVLVGYATGFTPEQAHAACMALLRAGGRHTAMAPGRYVLCDGTATDGAAWRALPVLAQGPGR
jgi:hypothetical protein